MASSVWTVMKDMENPMDARRYFLDHLPRKPCMVRPKDVYCVLCFRINTPVARVCPVWAEQVDDEEEEEIIEGIQEEMEMISDEELVRPTVVKDRRPSQYADIDILDTPAEKKTMVVEDEYEVGGDEYPEDEYSEEEYSEEQPPEEEYSEEQAPEEEYQEEAPAPEPEPVPVEPEVEAPAPEPERVPVEPEVEVPAPEPEPVAVEPEPPVPEPAGIAKFEQKMMPQEELAEFRAEDGFKEAEDFKVPEPPAFTPVPEEPAVEVAPEPEVPEICVYCGATREIQDGHIIAPSKGGKMGIKACATCNTSKGDKALMEWLRWVVENRPERWERFVAYNEDKDSVVAEKVRKVRDEAKEQEICVYCGATENIQIGHIVAPSKGGKMEVKACGTCNSSKGDKPLMEWLRWVKENRPERWESFAEHNKGKRSEVAQKVQKVRDEPAKAPEPQPVPEPEPEITIEEDEVEVPEEPPVEIEPEVTPEEPPVEIEPELTPEEPPVEIEPEVTPAPVEAPKEAPGPATPTMRLREVHIRIKTLTLKKKMEGISKEEKVELKTLKKEEKQLKKAIKKK